jgi:hypothetical protein
MNGQDTSKRQHGTGKPRIDGRITPRFTIGVRFVAFVVLVALLAGGVVGFVMINTSGDSLRQEILLNNLAGANQLADYTSNYVKVVQANLRSFARRPIMMQTTRDNEFTLPYNIARWL